ncbi:MAG: hypothetical protein ABSC93_04870 [Bryobacteraceae bacterium]|jgi:hypothetical protein
MKFFGAAFVAILAVGPLSAQYWSVGGFGNVAFPGLGHAPAGGNPWGNVVSPALPQGAAAASAGVVTANRYGSLVTGFRSSGGGGRGARRGTGGIYAYPVFVGGYGYGYGNGAAQPDQPAADAGVNPQAPPPVVINQYFGAPPADPGSQGPPAEGAASNFHYYQAQANEDTAPSDTPYYLIAFKDHTVYSAVAYYTEGDTLHYFTSGNVHNQASLSLVDRQLTEQLNRAHNVDLHLPN